MQQVCMNNEHCIFALGLKITHTYIDDNSMQITDKNVQKTQNCILRKTVLHNDFQKWVL